MLADKCPNVSEAGVEALLQGCPNLQLLDLSGCCERMAGELVCSRIRSHTAHGVQFFLRLLLLADGPAAAMLAAWKSASQDRVCVMPGTTTLASLRPLLARLTSPAFFTERVTHRGVRITICPCFCDPNAVEETEFCGWT